MRDVGGVKNITGAELAMVLADDTQITVDSSHIRMNGIVLDDSTSTGSQFTIGAAVTGQLTITIMNEDGAYSEYNFRDATAQLTFYGIEDLPEDAEVVPVQTILIGQYNIVDYTYDGSDITLTAYDNLSKFDFPCTELAGETLTFPITIQDLVIKAARICGVVLKSPTNPIPNGSYTITQKPEQWDTMTWHDVISYCAQLGGTFVKADSYGRVYFDWYNINVVHESYDGGTFNTSDTPYSDGDTLDGGNFDYDGTEASADGGNFDWPTDMHYVDSPYALTIDTDDVYITGFKVILKSTDNINADQDTQDYTTALYGTEGYVVTISGNPFIQTTGHADAVKDFLGPIVTGMWFRPMNATIDEDLSIEAGDQAYVTGLNGDTYQCFVSHVTYTVNAATTFSCDAEPNSASHKTRFTASDKLAAHVGRVERKLSEVGGIAGNTNQYFWHTETGTDTGAHITEVPQEEWDDPNSTNYHSGGNLLARSNGIAVRDGLTELAQFGTRVVLGDPASTHVEMDSDSLELYNSIPTRCLAISASDSQVTVPVIVSDNPSLAFDTSSDTPATLSVSGTWTNMPTDSATFELLRVQIAYWFWFYVDSHRISYSDTQWITLVNGVGSYTVTKKFGSYVHNHNRTLTITYDAATKQITASITQAVFFEVFGKAYETNITSPAPAMLFGSLAPNGSIGGFSAAMGANLNAAGDYQLVIGKWNSNDPNDVFEIGNGTAENARSNIFSVDDDGNVLAVGDILQKGRYLDNTFFFANSPFQLTYCHARRFCGMIYFSMEIFISSAFVANYRYTAGTIYSNYVPTDLEVGSGHSTDGSYNPVGIVTWIANPNGDMQISLQSTAGPYVFIHGFYPYRV